MHKRQQKVKDQPLPMWVVKSNFFKQNTNNKLEEYPVESGQLWGLVVASQSK